MTGGGRSRTSDVMRSTSAQRGGASRAECATHMCALSPDLKSNLYRRYGRVHDGHRTSKASQWHHDWIFGRALEARAACFRLRREEGKGVRVRLPRLWPNMVMRRGVRISHSEVYATGQGTAPPRRLYACTMLYKRCEEA